MAIEWCYMNWLYIAIIPRDCTQNPIKKIKWKWALMALHIMKKRLPSQKSSSLRQVLFRAQNTDEITLWSSPHVRRKLSVMLLLARDIVNGSKYKGSQQKWAEFPENAIRLVNNVIIQITRPNSTSFHYSAFLNLHCLSVAKGFFCIRRKLHWGYLNFFFHKGRSHLQQF